MSRVISLIKHWTLLFALLVGSIIYLLFHKFLF